MSRGACIGGLLAVALALVALATARWLFEPPVEPVAVAAPASGAAAGSLGEEAARGFLYGRVTTHGGASYEGRLRWGGDQEAFWSDPFNGVKRENPWLAYVPRERRPKERRPIAILGLEIAEREREADLRRPFLARFGDLARLEARGREVRVVLKNGTAFDLDRFEASDFDDGVRIWQRGGEVVDLDSLEIRSVELLPSRPLEALPARLYGTVTTRQRSFAGFVQWNRELGLGSDELPARGRDGPLALRFDAMRSLERSGDRLVATATDGREVVLAAGEGLGERGVAVDDLRYGRVLVSWEAFARLELDAAADSGPAYDDFPPGHPLTGSVTTRDGRRFGGRLVFDLDESETTETLDAPFAGVDYAIPFGLVAAIALAGDEGGDLQRAQVILHNGEALRFEPRGDLGDANAGLLIFVAGAERPEYLSWSELERIDFDRPPAGSPPPAGPSPSHGEGDERR